MADKPWRGDPSTPDERSAPDHLVLILDAGISLQAETNSVLRACLAEGPKDATLARRGGRLSSAWVLLIRRADLLPSSATVADARGLLRYHHRLLAETIGYAYSVEAVRDPRSARHFSDHLGAPAASLRRLRQLIGHDGGQDRNPEEEAPRLARAIDNILYLASMSAGTLRPDFDWCDPSAVLRSAVAAVDPAHAPEGRLDVTLALGNITRIWADPALLTRAVGNLIDNALRHNPPGTRVTLAAAADARRLTVSIGDDGRGLPAGVAGAVATATATAVLPTEIGTGIATAIGLVAAHGGTVAYAPAGSGTGWELRLPLHPRPRRSGPTGRAPV